MDECVVCLEDCTMDISELRIDDCQCKCKYKIHFDCLSEYLKTNNNKCLYCGEEIFETNIINISYQPDIPTEHMAFNTIMNNNNILVRDDSPCSNNVKVFCYCIIAIIILFIFLSFIL